MSVFLEEPLASFHKDEEAKEASFAFLQGYLTSLQNRHLSKSDCLHFFKNASLEELEKILDEAQYPKADTFFLRLNAEKERFHSWIEKECPCPFLKDYLLLYTFYQNLKTMLKVFLSKEENLSLHDTTEALPAFFNDLLYPRKDAYLVWQSILKNVQLVLQEKQTAFSEEKEDSYFSYLASLREFFALTEPQKSQQFLQHLGYALEINALPSSFEKEKAMAPFLEKVLQYLIKDYMKKQNLSLIEQYLDHAYFFHLETLAHLSQRKVLVDFVRLEIDLANEKNLQRLPNFSVEKEEIQAFCLAGGKYSPDDFEKQYFQPNSFERETSNTQSFSITKNQEEEKIRFWKQAVHEGRGFALFAAYFYQKQAELQNLRILSSLRTLGKNEQAIENLLREG